MFLCRGHLANTDMSISVICEEDVGMISIGYNYGVEHMGDNPDEIIR